MGSISKVEHNTLAKWERLARFPNLSPEYAFQIARNIDFQRNRLRTTSTPAQPAPPYIAPAMAMPTRNVRLPWFKRTFKQMIARYVSPLLSKKGK